MLSVPDLAVVGALALILFGPDQLPKVARRAGHVMREVQNTSQAFLREMERAADEHDIADERKAAAEAAPHASPADEYAVHAPAGDHAAPPYAGADHHVPADHAAAEHSPPL